MNKGLKISIIGSGNVACHLARALMHNNRIDAVFSRNIDNARQLAEITGAPAVDTINALPDSSDIYIIAVSDDAIPTISQQLSRKNGVVVHTSGSTPMSILSNNAQHGVFYPFQTFSKHKELNIKTVPFLIEANE